MCVLRDDWRRLQRQIVAIDALNFKHPNEQYQKNKIKRELNKVRGHFQVYIILTVTKLLF